MTPRPPTRLRLAAAWLALGPLIAVVVAMFLVALPLVVVAEVAAAVVDWVLDATEGRTWWR